MLSGLNILTEHYQCFAKEKTIKCNKHIKHIKHFSNKMALHPTNLFEKSLIAYSLNALLISGL